MAPRGETRRRMLAAASELFRAQGYHATGLNQLLGAGGAPKGSLYFHFPGGKEQLAAEAVRGSGDGVCQLLDASLAAAPDPATAVHTVVEAMAADLVESDFRHGCPVATVALDAADREPVRQACADSYHSWQRAIAAYLREHGVADDRADSLAAVILSAIEGGLLLAKTHRDAAPLRAVGDHLRITVKKELSE